MQTYVITGANRGIGLELCRNLSSKNHKIIAVCRKASETLKKLPVSIIENIDISDERCIVELGKTLAGTKIDVLINNAGTWADGKLSTLSTDSLLLNYKINAVGPLLITQQLLPNIPPGGKVVMITSRMGSIGDNGSGGRYDYRMSKAALNAAAKSLAIDLKEKGVAVGIIHPGFVATDMGGPKGVPVDLTVNNILKRIEEYELSNSGAFKHANGEELPW